MDLFFTIGRVAKILGLSIQTLRRWDETGLLVANRSKKGANRHYTSEQLEEFCETGRVPLQKMAKSWIQDKNAWEPLSPFYCRTIPHFELRLHRLEQQLAQDGQMASTFQLVSSTAGEIGNNSFDHNLGNWPDVPGIFFGHDQTRKQIVLADRGQGVLTTLQRVKPDLRDHAAALEVAFTQVLSSRSPENRGNGLKFVRKIVRENRMHLHFQSGNAIITIKSRSDQLFITQTKKRIQGCLAILTYIC